MDENKPHVVVLGGGFAGLSAAKELAKANVSITLVDRQNHHLFQPLLYQVASGGLSATEIAQPLRYILSSQTNVRVIMDEVAGIDRGNRRVSLRKTGSLQYDYLVVGLGLKTSYFGNDAWEAHAPGLKSLDEATEIRRRILMAFEQA
jgi:NADH dehydrogenase